MNKNNDTLLLTVGIFLSIFILIVIVIMNFFSGTKSTTSQERVLNQIPDYLKKEYSSFSKITPGKDNLAMVKKINGEPSRIKIDGSKTYLFYKTPNSSYTNVVLLVNGVVLYALENVFYTYKGYYSDYLDKYGQPNLVVYGKETDIIMPYAWGIFLNKGLGVQSSNNYVTALIYFSPKKEGDFLNSVAKDLGLSKNEGLGIPEQVNPIESVPTP